MNLFLKKVAKHTIHGNNCNTIDYNLKKVLKTHKAYFGVFIS